MIDTVYVVYREYEAQRQKFRGIMYVTDNEENAEEMAKKLRNIYKVLKQKVIIDVRKMRLYDTTTIDILKEVAEVGEITLEEKDNKELPLFKERKKRRKRIATSEEIIKYLRSTLGGNIEMKGDE